MCGRDVPAGKQRLQCLRIAVRLRRSHHQLRTHHKRPEKFPHRDIKTARGFLQYHIARRHRIVVLHPPQAVNNRSLADHHALWSPRRAGGENHIGGMLRAREIQRGRVGGRQRRVVNHQRLGGEPGKTRFQRRAGDHPARPGVLEHHLQTVVGVAGIQRQPGCADLDNRL